MNDLVADLTFQLMQFELMRLDIFIHRQIRRLQQSRPAGAGEDPLQALYLSADRAFALLQQPFGYGLTLSDGELGAYEQALGKVAEQSDGLIAAAGRNGEWLRLSKLATLFGLSRFELDIFLITIAPALDLRYEAIYGFLRNDSSQKRPTVNMALDLLCPPGPERLLKLAYLWDDGPLVKHRLLKFEGEANGGLLNQTLYPDDGLVAWLLGRYRPDTDLRHHLHYQPQPAAHHIQLTQAQQEALQQAAQSPAVLVGHGADTNCQKVAAAYLCQLVNQPLLTLNLASMVADNLPPLETIRLALRDGLLTGATVCLTDWDSCLADDAPPPELLTLVCQHPGRVIISSKNHWQARSVVRDRDLFYLEFPIPDYAHRLQLLERLLEPLGKEADLKLADLAGQFVLTTGQLQDVVNSARDLAARSGRDIANQDLFAAARAHSNQKLGSLARKITPRHNWQDLILPDDQIAILRELLNTVKSRPLVLHQWGLGKKLTASAGITVLFAGPPGTGKTMAAEILAGELGLDLYKINLSSVVSKYIGETEKNLEKIFQEAESSNAILFFDEADSIFGKRSEVKDAHDRYANIEVSYLLQRMEGYDGVTILATNLRSNLDEAFTRRLQFALDFPFPEEQDRLRIWQALFPTTIPKENNLDLQRLAESFRLAGGNIRNIIVNAAYLAATNGQKVTMEHLLHGTRRELQKMGRLVDEESLEL